MTMIIKSKSPWQTERIATGLAKKAIQRKLQRSALVFALEGELGAGKTTFVKGFARALGVKAHITSPTFVILRSYRLSATNHQLVHIDAYRLRDHRDLIPLGIKEIVANPKNIVLIEWAERVRKILPRKYIKVHIDHLSKNARKITISK